MRPETRYARSGDVSIAYQVLGDAAIDLVYVPGMISNVEYDWQVAAIGDWWHRLSSFSRLIVFDKRGTGLSDRSRGVATLEERIDDVRAVMEEAGSERAVVFGDSDGGAMATLFGATHPERTIGLILYGTIARGSWAADYPWGSKPDDGRWMEEMRKTWGTVDHARQELRHFAPSVADDPDLVRVWASGIRFSATPGAFEALVAMNAEIDIRHVLPTVRVPTLVLHRTDDRAVSVDAGRYVAEQIPGARFVELPGEDHFAWWGDSKSLAAEIERFVCELGAEATFDRVLADRVLATVFFTDIVGSTEKAVELGDRGWHDLVERHHAVVRGQLGRFRGREIDTAGDGFFASFDGPARAIRCACAIRQAIRDLGLEIRAGLHTGEVELADGRPRGIAVHIGARVAAKAQPGEVLVSNTVKDLVAGSGIEFDDRGTAELKGVPGEWRLYAVRS